MITEKSIDKKAYAQHMRVYAVRDRDGNIVCSPELWEEIAQVLEYDERGEG